MLDILRDSPAGRILRFLSNNRLAAYPEDDPEFNLPARYDTGDDILVTWNSGTDPENPYNWSSIKKLWVGMLLFVYTFTVYIGSSLYTTSQTDIVETFGVSEIAASMGLTIYVLAYGIGPMLWSPLSEILAIGRNLLYITTFFVFVILCVPMSLVNNFAGLLVLRFYWGFLVLHA